MLNDALITPKTACFCLIDQRTFECHWTTVEAIARHKRQGYKIELFYFLAQKWLDRAWASTRDAKKLAAWWGTAITIASAHCRLLSVHSPYAIASETNSAIRTRIRSRFTRRDRGRGQCTT